MPWKSAITRRATLAPLLFAAALLPGRAPFAAEFSVSPIRVELKPGVLSETITVTNHAPGPLRVSVKLMEWTQDAAGQDVYRDSSDLVYFPRQMEVAPGAKRLVRVGMKAPAGVVERTYRLFIEEEPEPAGTTDRAQVAFHFRFGVPIFLTPAAPRPQPEVEEPTLAGGKVALVVKNTGNQHFRVHKVTVSDGQGDTTEVAGWYSLAGSRRTYTVELPREACRRARTLSVAVEGEGLRIERKLNVDAANCG